MWVQFLGQEDPLEEGMATHSRILAWRMPWTEESGGLQSLGSQSQTRLKRLSTQAADSHLAFGGTQHSLSRPGLTGSLEKGLPASHFTVTQAMRKAGSWGPARPWGLGAHVPGSSRGRRRGRDRPGEPGLGGRRGWAGVHTVRVTLTASA